MPLRPKHTLLILGLAASTLGVTATAGQAATRVMPKDIDALPLGAGIEYGEATLALSSSAASKMKSGGVKASASGGQSEVKGKNLILQLQEKGSLIDPMKMNGSVALAGGINFKGKKGTAKLSSIVLSPGKAKKVTAKVGSKKVTLGSLTGGKNSFKPYADGILTGATLKLSSGGASALSKAAGGGFSAGSFAKVNIVATARELPLTGGTAEATITPGFADILAANGITLGAVAPATYANNVATLKLTGGAFYPEGLTGRLAFDGTITMTKGDRVIKLYGFKAALYPGQNEVFGSINDGIAAPIGTIDVSTMAASLNGTQFIATGAKLNLTKIAVASMKTSFGVTVAEGTQFATVNMTGVTPSGGS